MPTIAIEKRWATMPQLSLYLDEETMELLQKAAAESGESLSKRAARAIRESCKSNEWPEGHFDLFGSLADVDIEAPDDPPFDPDEIEALL